MFRLFSRIFLAVLAPTLLLSGCIEDGFSYSTSDGPTFSVDTLDMGTVYTDEPTSTFSFKVFNPHDKGLNISSVTLSGEDADIFRLNVDGFSGSDFTDVEIRANDSIFVFVQATPPANGQLSVRRSSATVNFLVNGVQYPVVLILDGQDIERISGLVVASDTVFTATRPYRVTDSLVVAPGATLTLDPGVNLLMHDNAYIAVDGTLISQGTAQNPVRITGDRMGEVIPGVTFDIMSRQWDGILFSSSSSDNYLAFTEISNTTNGLTIISDGILSSPALTLRNCRLRNSGSLVLTALDTYVDARGCEFAEAADGLILLNGGTYRFDLCTVANNYLFSAISGAAWQFPSAASSPQSSPANLPTNVYVTNSITYGLGSDVDPGSLMGYNIRFERCLFKAEGEDDENFISSLWNVDPLFYTIREDYVFDYRLKPESPAIGTAFTALSDQPLATDFYGNARNADLGAYVFVSQ